MTDNDDALRARLRAADPARHLTDPRHLELTEAPMTDPTTPARPNRTRLALAAAAAAVLVLAGVGVVAGLGDDEEPVAKDDKPGVVEPTAAATYALPTRQPAARCLPPNVAGARELDVAFEGKVASRTDDAIVLDVVHTWQSPDPAQRVELEVSRAEGAIAEALPFTFEVGKSYIIAIEGGSVRLCTWSGESNPQLRATYDEAFPS